MIDQFTIKSRNQLNKAYSVETVRNSKLRRADMFNKPIVT